MHWTLEQVLGLEEGVYAELVAWLNEQAEAQSGGGGGVDMDAVMQAKSAGKAQP